MDSFDEHSEKGQDIVRHFKYILAFMQDDYEITLKSPPQDIARRFLNEIEEFTPAKED